MCSAAELLEPVLAAVHIRLAPARLALLCRHFDLLQRWNQRMSLSAIRDPKEIAIKHFGESLFLASRLAGQSGSLADVGSGAGFPGFPIAVAVPSLRVTLVEAVARKAAFLKEVARGVSGVEVHVGRFDSAAAFDWVSLRGVAPRPLLASIAKKARYLAILTGPTEARKLSSCESFAWDAPIKPPWDTGRVLVVGRIVPRGTELE